jgi:hypothetical protein
MSREIQNYFDEHGFVVIKKFLDESTVGLLYRYSLNRVRAMDFKYMHDREKFNVDWDGEWTDPQAPGCYSDYGDILMDTVLASVTPMMSSYTGLNLMPNYSYWRLYQKGTELVRHRDRYSCEISTTVCLGYDTSNLDPNQHKDYSWPIWIEDKISKEELAVSLLPGDMIIYRGCDLDHWREPFLGLAHAQLFMHYNKVKENEDSFYDGRPIPGIPKKFQRSNFNY